MDVDRLRDLAVVSVQQAEKLGIVDDVLIDPRTHRLGGLILSGGLFRGGPTVAWACVRTIGADAVMVDDTVSATAGVEESTLTRLHAMRGRKVVTDTGDLAGTLDGAEFDPASGQITSYLVATEGGRPFQRSPRLHVPPAAIEGIGKELITVDAKVIEFQRRSDPE